MLSSAAVRRWRRGAARPGGATATDSRRQRAASGTDGIGGFVGDASRLELGSTPLHRSTTAVSWSRIALSRATSTAVSIVDSDGLRSLVGEAGLVPPIEAATALPSTVGTICMSAASSAGTIAGTITAGTSEKRMRSLTASSASRRGAMRGVSSKRLCAGTDVGL